jgi:hypothetical protein
MIPSDEQLYHFVSTHKGTAKELLALARTQWDISEKRLRKAIPKNLEPKTAIDPALRIDNIDIKLVPGKGKGLYAATELLEGQVLWQEEPWITTADP